MSVVLVAVIMYLIRYYLNYEMVHRERVFYENKIKFFGKTY